MGEMCLEHKTCSRCRESKVVGEFHRRGESRHQSQCKQCATKSGHEHYLSNKSRFTLRRRATQRTIPGKYKKLVARHQETWQGAPITEAEFRDLVHGSRCSYCSGPLPPFGVGIDRVDSRMGYVTGNCQPCCSHCNNIKRRLPHWLFVIVWQSLLERYPHLAHLDNPWADPKISWMLRKENN